MACIAIILTQTVEAQIKRQYKDEKVPKQTVVIKEGSSMSDMEILNSEFDLDDYTVGEQIRITTENLPEQAPETPEVLQEEEILVSVDRTSKVHKPAPDARVIKAAPKKSTYVQGTYPRKSNSKIKNKRVRKKKRKRRNRNKCYRF